MVVVRVSFGRHFVFNLTSPTADSVPVERVFCHFNHSLVIRLRKVDTKHDINRTDTPPYWLPLFLPSQLVNLQGRTVSDEKLTE